MTIRLLLILLIIRRYTNNDHKFNNGINHDNTNDNTNNDNNTNNSVRAQLLQPMKSEPPTPTRA